MVAAQCGTATALTGNGLSRRTSLRACGRWEAELICPFKFHPVKTLWHLRRRRHHHQQRSPFFTNGTLLSL